MKTTSKKQPNDPQPPRGLLKLPDRPDRPSPFGVQWRVDGRRKKEFFGTQELRDLRFEELAKASRKGVLADEPTREEKSAWRAFQEACGGASWQDVVAGWRSHLAAAGLSICEITVAKAVPEFLAAMKARVDSGTLSLDHHRHQKATLKYFNESFCANKLDAIKGEEIEAWIDDLGFASPFTFNSYVKIISAFFAHYRKVVKTNPCEEIEFRSTNSDRERRLSVEATKALFEFSQKNHPEALGRLALEFFAGLRFSSAFRLEKHEINFEDKGILFPARKLKTEMRKGRRRYVDGLPENLWPWLEATNEACWAMESSQWMHLKSDLFLKSGVKNPGNCARHSFCTYHVAAFKDPGKTATILCHRNQQKVWDTYNGIATQAEGKAYFEILPNAELVANQDNNDVERREGRPFGALPPIVYPANGVINRSADKPTSCDSKKDQG